MNARSIAHAVFALIATVALAACSAPTVPDFTYYRLPRPEPLEAAPKPLFGDIVVDVFAADGLYGDQALIYATDPGAQNCASITISSGPIRRRACCSGASSSSCARRTSPARSPTSCPRAIRRSASPAHPPLRSRAERNRWLHRDGRAETPRGRRERHPDARRLLSRREACRRRDDACDRRCVRRRARSGVRGVLRRPSQEGRAACGMTQVARGSRRWASRSTCRAAPVLPERRRSGCVARVAATSLIARESASARALLAAVARALAFARVARLPSHRDVAKARRCRRDRRVRCVARARNRGGSAGRSGKIRSNGSARPSPPTSPAMSPQSGRSGASSSALRSRSRRRLVDMSGRERHIG